MKSRGIIAPVMLIVGLILLVVAFATAPAMTSAQEDLNAFLAGKNGMPPSEVDVYLQISAASYLLRNVYVAVSGLILLSAGAFGLACNAQPRKPQHEDIESSSS